MWGYKAAIIDYAIDLSNSSQEELIYWDLFAVLLDHDASPWHKYARNQGINNIMEAYLDLALPLPALKFRLRNGEASQMEEFKASIGKGLKERFQNILTTARAPHSGLLQET